MTLILALGNQDQVVVVSDRRVSESGKAVILAHETETDESNKAFEIRLRNARLAAAFTGIASDGKGFLTNRWLPEALMESAKPDSLLGPTIQRFSQRATRDFARLSHVSSLDKRLSILVTVHAPSGRIDGLRE